MKNKFKNKTIDYLVILIFAISKFRNISRSTFRPFNFWPPLLVDLAWNLPCIGTRNSTADLVIPVECMHRYVSLWFFLPIYIPMVVLEADEAQQARSTADVRSYRTCHIYTLLCPLLLSSYLCIHSSLYWNIETHAGASHAFTYNWKIANATSTVQSTEVPPSPEKRLLLEFTDFVTPSIDLYLLRYYDISLQYIALKFMS